MFGYVVINQGEMKFKDYDIYHSYYCGLCRSLKEAGGRCSQLTLSYDTTFLVMVLTALYELPPEENMLRCVAHPTRKHLERTNNAARYCADMNIILTYYKCMDDWEDEKKTSRYLYGKLLKGRIKKMAYTYPEKMEAIAAGLKKLRTEELAGNTNPDEMASIFGEIMGELFCWKEDEWKFLLYRMGFYLGKFIYLMDAFEDVEEDKEKGNYNPFLGKIEKMSWKPVYGESDFDDKCEKMLRMMMAESAKAYEMLPIIWYEDIIRNILYSGVWTRFEMIKKKRGEKQEEEHERSL